MKLHAVNRQVFVAYAHDDFFARVVCGGCDFEAIGDACWVDREGVITHDGERTWDALKEAGSVVCDFRAFAVHDGWCLRDFCVMQHADSLMPEADAQDWHLACEGCEDFKSDREIGKAFWGAGAR